MLLAKRMLDGYMKMRLLHRLITIYLDNECELLSEEHSIHNISSVIIESEFGIFKDSMPSNKANGFMESTLYFPLRSKAAILENVTN